MTLYKASYQSMAADDLVLKDPGEVDQSMLAGETQLLLALQLASECGSTYPFR